MVKDPSPERVEEVKEVAAGLGELGRLSRTDLRLLALVKELSKSCREVIVVSDDRSVQNVALALGADVQGVKRRVLRKARKYVYVCPSCGRVFEEPGTCPICGVKLVRVRYSKIFKSRG